MVTWLAWKSKSKDTALLGRNDIGNIQIQDKETCVTSTTGCPTGNLPDPEDIKTWYHSNNYYVIIMPWTLSRFHFEKHSVLVQMSLAQQWLLIKERMGKSEQIRIRRWPGSPLRSSITRTRDQRTHVLIGVLEQVLQRGRPWGPPFLAATGCLLDCPPAATAAEALSPVWGAALVLAALQRNRRPLAQLPRLPLLARRRHTMQWHAHSYAAWASQNSICLPGCPLSQMPAAARKRDHKVRTWLR